MWFEVFLLEFYLKQNDNQFQHVLFFHERLDCLLYGGKLDYHKIKLQDMVEYPIHEEECAAM